MVTGEAAIAKQCIGDLLAAGYLISVNDGEETTLRRSTDPAAIFAAMNTTDEDWLCVHEADQPVYPGDDDTRRALGWVRFIYGNEPCDVINDYAPVRLESVLKPTLALCDQLDSRG